MTQQLYSWGLYPRKTKICPKNDLYGNAHWSFIYNNPKLETAQMFINARMDKQIVAHVHNRILASNKKEWNTDTWNSMNKSQRKNNPLRELKKPSMEKQKQYDCISTKF
jgi:hypothetical protein